MERVLAALEPVLNIIEAILLLACAFIVASIFKKLVLRGLSKTRLKAQLYEEVAPWAAGLELNISCPNIAAGGAAMGGTPEGAASVVKAVRDRTARPLVVKMAPARVPEIARALEDAGADALSLINTIPAMSIDVRTRRSRLSRPTAGLSGPAIHPIAVRMVWEAHNACKLPLCGIGGVRTGADAAEFILAGATAVSVGTATRPPLCRIPAAAARFSVIRSVFISCLRLRA